VSAGNGEVMGRLTYAFGQITSIGRLMGTELRQLTEAGFNPLEFISKKTGESMIQLKKRMEDGGVSLQEVEEALTAATSAGGRFYGLNEKMSQTFSGRVSMMKDQWVQLTAAMGDGMNRGLKIAIDAVTNGLPKFKEQFMAIGNVIGDAIGEAVAGDMGKLTAIGDLIGSTIAAAATAAFQAGSTGLVAGAENLARGGIRKGIAVVAGEQTAESVLPNMQGASFKELLDAALINRGIQEKAAAIMGNGPQTYIPSASSPAAVEEFNQRRVEMIDERMSRQSPPWIQEILKQNELQRQMLDELKKANKEGSKL
jgi:tape measure domain-containing protein